jgi:hypothetical protein
VCVCVYVCVYVCMYVCMYISMEVCVRELKTHTYIYTYIHTYITHTHTHTPTHTPAQVRTPLLTVAVLSSCTFARLQFVVPYCCDHRQYCRCDKEHRVLDVWMCAKRVRMCVAKLPRALICLCVCVVLWI